MQGSGDFFGHQPRPANASSFQHHRPRLKTNGTIASPPPPLIQAQPLASPTEIGSVRVVSPVPGQGQGHVLSVDNSRAMQAFEVEPKADSHHAAGSGQGKGERGVRKKKSPKFSFLQSFR